jgi:hypothetical protein
MRRSLIPPAGRLVPGSAEWRAKNAAASPVSSPSAAPAADPVDRWRRDAPAATPSTGGPPKIIGAGGTIPGWRLRQMEKEKAEAAGAFVFRYRCVQCSSRPGGSSPASSPAAEPPRPVAAERVPSQSGGISFVSNANGEERKWQPSPRTAPLANATSASWRQNALT